MIVITCLLATVAFATVGFLKIRNNLETYNDKDCTTPVTTTPGLVFEKAAGLALAEGDIGNGNCNNELGGTRQWQFYCLSEGQYPVFFMKGCTATFEFEIFGKANGELANGECVPAMYKDPILGCKNDIWTKFTRTGDICGDNYPVSTLADLPTTQCVGAPTARPSARPSSRPSAYPSTKPTVKPSAHPTYDGNVQGSTDKVVVQVFFKDLSSGESSQVCTQGGIFYNTIKKPIQRALTVSGSQIATQANCEWNSDDGVYDVVGLQMEVTSLTTTQSASLTDDLTSGFFLTFLKNEMATHGYSGSGYKITANWLVVEPSARPTWHPTGKPTGKPSEKPTAHPSSKPSWHPSQEPSGDPSIDPTLTPTSKPSLNPTPHPSVIPSLPSSFPSTAEPSPAPTPPPSPPPTTNPTPPPTPNPTPPPTPSPTNPTPPPTMSDNPTPPPTLPPNVPSPAPADNPTPPPSVGRPQPTPNPTLVPPTPSPSHLPTPIPSPPPTIYNIRAAIATVYTTRANALGMENNRDTLEAVCGKNVFSEFAPLVKQAREYQERVGAYERWIDVHENSGAEEEVSSERSLVEADDNAKQLVNAVEEISTIDLQTLEGVCEAVIALNAIPATQYGRVKSLKRLDDIKNKATPMFAAVDMWSALYVYDESIVEENLVLHSRLVDEDERTAMRAFNGVCHDTDGNVKKFAAAWDEMQEIAARYEEGSGKTYGLPDDDESQVLAAFGKLSQGAINALCKVGRQKYHVQEPIEGYWGASMKRNIQTNRKEYWIGKLAADVSHSGFDALVNAQDQMWRAIASDFASAKATCDDLVAHAPFDVFDTTASLAFKQSQNEILEAFHGCFAVESTEDNSFNSGRFLTSNDNATVSDWERFENHNTLCMGVDDLSATSSMSFADLFVLILNCRDTLQKKLALMDNKNNGYYESPKIYCEDVLVQNATEITLGNLAFWGTDELGDHYFHCVENIKTDAQTKYLDNRLRVCGVVAQNSASSVSGMTDAFSEGVALNMESIAGQIKKMNTPLIPINEGRWVSVDKADSENFEVKPIPSLAFRIIVPEGSNIGLQSMKEEVQRIVDIGVFDRLVVDEWDRSTIEYEVSDAEVISHIENIQKFLAKGFSVDGIYVAVESMLIAAELRTDMAAAFEAAEVEYSHIQYKCAMKKDDLTPRKMAPENIETMESQETTGDASATRAPVNIDNSSTNEPSTTVEEVLTTTTVLSAVPAQTIAAAVALAGVVALF